MGRELKRVKMDFSWRVGAVWEGYLNPYSKHARRCESCDGSGTTASYKVLERLIQLLMIAGEDSKHRPSDFNPRRELPINIPTYPGSPYNRLYPHPYLIEAGINDPGSDLHDLTAKLAGRKTGPFGHDCCDKWSAFRKILKAAGLSKRWGRCKPCNGSGSIWDDPKIKTKHSHWRRKEPPKGKGYQMWETVTEGSPISPVFADPDALAGWLAKNEGGTFQNWRKTIDAEWVPSMIATPETGLITGVEAAGRGAL